MPPTSGQPARHAAHALAALLALLLLSSGCGPGTAPSSEEASAAAQPAAAASAPGNHVAAPAQPAADPLAGTWWVFMPDRPYLAFRLSLEPAAGDDLEGSWTSFDWLASKQAEDLRHRSKGVRVTGEVDDDTLLLTAPAPMLDANGQPNGQRGTWCLELKGNNLPGEPRRYSGHATCTELKDATGVLVTVERDFRPWKP